MNISRQIKSYPDLKSLLLLSEYFKISLDELVKGDMEKMKSELQKNQMNNLSRIMLISAVLMFFSIPIAKILRPYGFIVTGIFMIIMLWTSIKIEIIKKDKNLQTYKEIKAYMENDEISIEDRTRNQGGFWVKKVLIAIVCAIISGTLVSLILKCF